MLRLMCRACLPAPNRGGNGRGPKGHDGTFTIDLPDRMWGTDSTATVTGEGQAAIFITVDHCTQECIGIHSALQGTSFEALEPICQGIREHYGSYTSQVAPGLMLRHDNGSQHTSSYFKQELRFLGTAGSPAYVREPKSNGVAERLIRTLMAQQLWLQHFETVPELKRGLQALQRRYNRP